MKVMMKYILYYTCGVVFNIYLLFKLQHVIHQQLQDYAAMHSTFSMNP